MMTKISQHWLILGAAVFFEIFGLIPFLGVVSNFLFGLVLLLHFGPKSGFSKIGKPIMFTSIIDLILMGAFPACIGSALYRIWKN